MSITLFKASFRAHWKFVLGVTLFIMMYVAVSISMYDPTSAQKLMDMMEMLPEGLMKAMGFDNLGSELTPYLSNYLYGFIMLIFPLIGSSVLANSLIAKHVDSTSMAYLLTTPNTRVKIVLTQAMFLVLSMTFIFAVNVGVALMMSEASYAGMLDIAHFIQLNIVAYLVSIVISAISFLASCIFSDAKTSLSVGVGVPVLFALFKMISEISDKVSNLRFFTVYSLIDIERILSGDPSFVLTVSVLLIVASTLIYGLSIVIFNKKSLVI